MAVALVGAGETMNFGGNIRAQHNPELILRLQEELQFTEFIANYAVEAAFCLRSDGRFVYVNNAACAMAGYSREKLLSMSLPDIELNLSLEAWLGQWRSLKQWGSLTLNTRYRTESGQILPVEVTLTYTEHHGREFGYAFVRDQTGEALKSKVPERAVELRDNQQLSQEDSKLKQTEADLETSLALLSSTLESTANGIVAVSFEGEILSVNQKFVEMWQIPDGVVLSRKCARCKDFFENQLKDPAAFRRVLWEVSSQSDFESYDILELKDSRIFAHYSKPQRIGERIIGRVWSVWDITQSKQTEKALRLNEARFRTLAETTDAVIFIIQNTQIRYVNPITEAITGYTKEELLNDFDLRQLVKSRKRRQKHKQAGAAFPEYEEMSILTKTGIERWLACSVAVLDGVIDFAGKPVELVTAIDITDYKHSEVEVRQALEQAKQLSELRTRFISTVCHQLRTPLNIVSFSTSLLKRHLNQSLQGTKQLYLEHIQTAVEQISQLLDEVLFFSKTETTELKAEPIPLDLDSFCHDLAVQMQFSSSSRKVITFASRGDLSAARVDKKLLQPILTNLLSNAIKYSPPDSPVSLLLSRQGDHMYFLVEDAGIGIPSADQQQLFEPFHRGGNVDHIPGTGLGLSIVKTLVDLHGGQIAVVSEVGLGTQVTVMLPLVS